MSLAFRDALAPDLPFVVGSWIDCQRWSHTAGHIAMEDWHDVMWVQYNKTIARPETRTIVAHESEITDHIADLQGCIVFDHAGQLPMVFFVYVKLPYRGVGYARALFKAAGIDPAKPFLYGCRSADVSRIVNARKIPCAKFEPVNARYANRREYEQQQSKREQGSRRGRPEIVIERRRSAR